MFIVMALCVWSALGRERMGLALGIGLLCIGAFPMKRRYAARGVRQ